MPGEQDALIPGPRRAEDVQKGHVIRVSRAEASFTVDPHRCKEMYASALFRGVSDGSAPRFFCPSD